MQSYEGYFENGQFRTASGVITLPEGRRVFIMVLEEPPILSERNNTNKIFWDEFDNMVDDSASEILQEENFKRLDFGRKLVTFADEEDDSL